MFLKARGSPLDSAIISDELRARFWNFKDRECHELDDVEVCGMTSEGEGLAIMPSKIYDKSCAEDKNCVLVIPKAVIGDRVKVRLLRHHHLYAEAELLRVQKSTAMTRSNDLVICQHFESCSGCQFQMMPYERQLEHKREVISRAYSYFCPGLDKSKVEDFGLVISSPLQYAYRTKLTPHAPISRKLDPTHLPLAVGFNHIMFGKGTVDVDRCPIATHTINKTLPGLKSAINESLRQKLLGNSTEKVSATAIMRDSIRVDHATGAHEYVCLTKNKQIATEKVGDFVFQFPVNDFFQCNRLILPIFLDFIRYQILLLKRQPKFILDTYCGSGLLGISLLEMLPDSGKIIGIEVAASSIEYAEHNAALNGLQDKTKYITGLSDAIFEHESFQEISVQGPNSLVIINPSRKGSNKEFLEQLVEFKPSAIVYVSCNVFTQARDLAMFLELCEAKETSYNVKAVTGFDFYPQTKHVESIVVLELRH